MADTGANCGSFSIQQSKYKRAYKKHICYYDRYLNGSEAQKARYTEIWTYFRDLAVDTQYYFAGGYGASVGELKLSDFNIEENPGEMLARLSDSQSVVSEWWKWWEK